MTELRRRTKPHNNSEEFIKIADFMDGLVKSMCLSRNVLSASINWIGYYHGQPIFKLFHFEKGSYAFGVLQHFQQHHPELSKIKKWPVTFVVPPKGLKLVGFVFKELNDEVRGRIAKLMGSYSDSMRVPGACNVEALDDELDKLDL